MFEQNQNKCAYMNKERKSNSKKWKMVLPFPQVHVKGVGSLLLVLLSLSLTVPALASKLHHSHVDHLEDLNFSVLLSIILIC